MEENIVETQMDKHLSKVQRQTKKALDTFRELGLNVSKKFIAHFLKTSVDRMSQTCERYKAEMQWKISCKDEPHGMDEKTTESTSGQEPGMNGNAVADENEIPREDSTVTGAKSITPNVIDPIEQIVPPDENKKLKKLFRAKNRAKILQVHHTVFLCVHCENKDHHLQYSSDTIDAIYEHWLMHHVKPEKFHFRAIGLSTCVYCKRVGTYHELADHLLEQHPNKPFAIADQLKKCAICEFEGDYLVEHFEAKHDNTVLSKMLDPIFYTSERITQFLSIDIKKNRSENPLIPHSVVCGMCKETFNYDHLVSHFVEHINVQNVPFNFHCIRCNFVSGIVTEVIYHENHMHGTSNLDGHISTFLSWVKEKIHGSDFVYDNGLVMRVYNMLGTKFDHSQVIQDMLNDSYNNVFKSVIEIIQKSNFKSPSCSGMPVGPSQKSFNPQKVIFVVGFLRPLGFKRNKEIFLKICNLLNVKICKYDITDISNVEDGKVVTLSSRKMREFILMRAQHTTIWMSDIIKLSKYETDRIIHFR